MRLELTESAGGLDGAVRQRGVQEDRKVFGLICQKGGVLQKRGRLREFRVGGSLISATLNLRSGRRSPVTNISTDTEERLVRRREHPVWTQFSLVL